MNHPFLAIPARRRKLLFAVLLAVTLALMGVMSLVGGPLETPASPYGIVSYELAGSTARAEEILASWNQRAQLYAAFSLGLDYVFMLAYSTTLGLACVWAGQALTSRRLPLARLGIPLAWGQWLAAMCDGIENLGLTLILFGAAGAPWPEVAFGCAVVKFALIFIGMIYAFFSLAVHLAGRLARAQS